jgi:transcriptional regulator with XRE-family HTH domain
MPSVKAFGEKIRCLRKAIGLTQLELALRAGVSERTVRNAERGQPVRHVCLEWMGGALGVEIQELVHHPAELKSLFDRRRQIETIHQFVERLCIDAAITDIQDLCHPNLVFAANIDPRFYGASFLNQGFSGRSGIPRFADFQREFQSEIIERKLTIEPPQGNGDLIVFRGTEDILYRDGSRDTGWLLHIFEFEDHRILRIDEFAGSFAVP